MHQRCECVFVIMRCYDLAFLPWVGFGDALAAKRLTFLPWRAVRCGDISPYLARYRHLSELPEIHKPKFSSRLLMSLGGWHGPCFNHRL